MIGIYARVSTDEQNIQQQIAVLERWCKERNLSYKVFKDEAISGKIEERPGWQGLLKACELKESREVDSILVTAYDRITRDSHYAHHFLEFVEKNKVDVHSVSDGSMCYNVVKDEANEQYFISLRQTRDRAFMFTLKCLLSQKELHEFDFRRAIGILRAKKEGKFKGGKRGRKIPHRKGG
jgi:DNA invertase Pin-like site-specific DNA recombinase